MRWKELTQFKTIMIQLIFIWDKHILYWLLLINHQKITTLLPHQGSPQRSSLLHPFFITVTRNRKLAVLFRPDLPLISIGPSNKLELLGIYSFTIIFLSVDKVIATIKIRTNTIVRVRVWTQVMTFNFNNIDFCYYVWY